MKILLLSVSVGAGHVRAAEAVETVLRERAAAAEIRHVDALDHVTPLMRAIYVNGSIGLINLAPAVYGFGYRLSDRGDGRTPFSDWLQGTQCGRLRRLVADFAPDAILATHFLPPRVLTGTLAPPIDVLVTDFDFHRMWLAPAARRFFVATEEIAARMAGIGVARERIVVTGLPVGPGFAGPVDRAAVLGRLELLPSHPTLLVSTGGAGMATLPAIVRELADLPPPVQIIAVAGRNVALRTELERLSPPSGVTLRVTGFVANMHELLQAADLVVAKPGGLTVAECLAAGAATVFTAAIPGQEEANAEGVARARAGMHVREVGRLAETVGRLLDDPAERARLRAAARLLGRPSAAAVVAQALLERGTVNGS